MLALVIAVFTASLLGSAHCAGMCGAFVAFAVGASGPEKQASRVSLNSAYNLGRLFTYLTIGAAAGSLGAALDLGGSLLGVQRAAALGAGAIMLGFGLVAALRAWGVSVPRLPLPAFLIRASKRGHALALDFSPVLRAGFVGLLTTLLPCGWLYAFAITSAGTASPLLGAVTMGAFWLGTLPMMAAIGLGVQSLAGPLRRHMPLATSVLLVAVGLWTVLGRMSVPALASGPTAPPATIDESVRSVGSREVACPLCSHK